MRIAFSLASAPPLVKNTLFSGPGAEFGDPAGSFTAHVNREPRSECAELAGLFPDRGDQFRVLVADVDVDQLAGEV